MEIDRSESPNMTTPIVPPGDESDLERHSDNDDHNDASSSTSPSSTGWCFSIVEILLCLIPVPIGIYLEFPTPYQRPIPYQSIDVDDNEYILRGLMYDNRLSGEIVRSHVMFVLAIAVPFVAQIALACCVGKGQKTALLHKTVCVYLLAIGLTQTLTNLAKQYVGYLRPIFYDTCQPDEDYEYCTSKDNRQGRLSFPSGHASLSVCGLLLLSLFLEYAFGKTSYQKSRTKPHKFVRIVSVLCYAPMLLALFILLSRVHDNHHHPADVVGGSLLGGSIASLVFGIWFS